MKFYRQLAHRVIYFRLNAQLPFLSTAPFSYFPLFHSATQLVLHSLTYTAAINESAPLAERWGFTGR